MSQRHAGGRRTAVLGSQALLCAAAWAAVGSSAQAQGCNTYLEQGGLLVVEIESAPVSGSWKSEVSNGGFTGSSYYRWDGPDMFSSPGVGVLRYDFQIQTAGTYRLAVHNRHDHPDSSLENDAWLRIDGGNWMKCYSNAGTGATGVWIWETEFEVGGTHLPPDVPLGAGLHSLEFSGRSHNFMMDRFHLALPGHPDAQNVFASPSGCVGAGNASVYCVGKKNSKGCMPSILVPAGQPSASTGSGFLVRTGNVINKQLGMFFYSDLSLNLPWMGGTLCVRPPFTRTPGQSSGGSGVAGNNCSGGLSFDVNAWIAGGNDPKLQPGSPMFGQFWYRDVNSTFGSGLSNAVEMVVQP